MRLSNLPKLAHTFFEEQRWDSNAGSLAFGFLLITTSLYRFFSGEQLWGSSADTPQTLYNTVLTPELMYIQVA